MKWKGKERKGKRAVEAKAFPIWGVEARSLG
jgi:hypothetical protein